MSADGVEDPVEAPAAFVVRAWRDAGGRLRGVVERVTTGERARFEGSRALAEIIERTVGGGGRARRHEGTTTEGEGDPLGGGRT
jgi:hypothetical protein